MSIHQYFSICGSSTFNLPEEPETELVFDAVKRETLKGCFFIMS